MGVFDKIKQGLKKTSDAVNHSLDSVFAAFVKGDDQLTREMATQIYDLFEAVVETELESLRAMLISIDVGAQVEVSFCVSAAEPLCGLRTRFPDLEWEQDEDGLQYVTRKLERSRG